MAANTHDWIDIASILGVLASTVIGVLLANRLSKHNALEDQVAQHSNRLAAIEATLDWIRREK